MKGKFITTAILASLLVGSNAMASIARQAVMGNHHVFTTASGAGVAGIVNGSLWYDDDYNVFYNPAYINDNKNYVTVQKGFEGGFFKSEFENFAYGVYVNRGGTGNAGNNYASGLVAPGFQTRTSHIGTANDLDTRRPIDLFIGGDTGIKWGLGVTWAYNRDQAGASLPNNEGAEISNRYWHFRLGAEVMGLEPFVGATLFSKYQNDVASQKSGAELNEFNAGLRYKYEGWSPYFAYNKNRVNGTAPGAQNQVQTRLDNYAVGVGHDTKVADGVHVYKHVGFIFSSVEDDAGAAGTTANGLNLTADQNRDYKDYVVPINVALEGEATSWLTLRAGIAYDLINQRKYADSNRTSGSTTNVTDKVASNAGITRFRIGSTIKFGKLHLDSAFGNGAAGGVGTENLDTSSMGFDGQTFALLSASYHW